jgi:hypothetical protein
VVSRIRSCFPAASPCRREGRLFLSFLKKTRAAREVAGLAESFAHGPAAVVLCASAGGARVCSGHAQRCACAGLSLANHRARAHTVLNALGLECLSVLCCWWAGEPSDRACAGEGNTEAGEAAVVLTRSVMRWPRPLAVSPSLAGASWWEPDLVVTGGHTHQSAREGKTHGDAARRRWSRRELSCVGHRCGASLLSRARRGAQWETETPQSAEARKPAARAPSSRRGVDGVPALALARHTTRTGTHTRTRARESEGR